MKKTQLTLHIIIWLVLICIACTNTPDSKDKKTRETEIADFLLHKLNQHKILVIPECLSHDSYDAVRLPLSLIKRWTEADHNIRKLFIGLETETGNDEFKLIQNNRYYQYGRFATICPPGWGLFSTKKLSEYLFYKEVKDKFSERFNIFGFENSFHYYDKVNKKYLIPSQIDTIANVDTIPFLKSQAPFIIKYVYSRFFRDYRSYSTIQQMIQNNPDAHFIIIIGNAHTSKEFYFDEADVDRQIIDAYKIDKEKYWHTVGYFLKQNHYPLFIQSNIDTLITTDTLFKFDASDPDTVRHKAFEPFYTDYIYSIPKRPDVNIEEQPLICLPSATNFSLLKNKSFQLCPDEEHIAIAQKIIYFMTGVVPEIKLDEPGKTGPCTFIDPETNEPLDFERFEDMILNWYLDGTFVKRLNEDVPAYDNRSLFKAIFRLMGKKALSPLSGQQAKLFINHLLALLSVIGTEDEQSFARHCLSQLFGDSQDYYYYYKKFYYEKYSMNKERD
jgi:hypothetical protein